MSVERIATEERAVCSESTQAVERAIKNECAVSVEQP